MRILVLGLAALLSPCADASAQSDLGPFDGSLVADALESCAPLIHPWWNPIVGEDGEATVEAGADGGCVYRNRMTKTFAMICLFDEPTRRAVAADLRRQYDAEEIKTSTSFREGEVVATYEIDGETYIDTLTIALNDGTCETVSAKP